MRLPLGGGRDDQDGDALVVDEADELTVDPQGAAGGAGSGGGAGRTPLWRGRTAIRWFDMSQ
ncbi:MAG: hypothetical protein ACO4CW_11165, partial [Planctomycetota bacterium]